MAHQSAIQFYLTFSKIAKISGNWTVLVQTFICRCQAPMAPVLTQALVWNNHTGRKILEDQ